MEDLVKLHYAETFAAITSLVLLIVFFSSEWRELIKGLLLWMFYTSTSLLMIEKVFKNMRRNKK